VDYARRQMGIDWMNQAELSQAIPPAYCEFIGKQLLQVLQPQAGD
jgi:DNA (cytosine-5)-methyltransferase 1